MRRTALILVVATGMAGSAGAAESPYETVKRLGAAMERCWFNSGDPSFAGYAYSPEPNASAAPRILIVPKDAPQERPVLVIELSRGNINAYGPMTTSPLAGRIGADLKRWLGGGEGCQ